jgi:hypothetical protein
MYTVMLVRPGQLPESSAALRALAVSEVPPTASANIIPLAAAATG